MLDVLDKAHTFELPPRMVDAEFEGIWSQVKADQEKGELSDEDKGKPEKKLKEEYRKIAERRVRLGLVLTEEPVLNRKRGDRHAEYVVHDDREMLPSVFAHEEQRESAQG